MIHQCTLFNVINLFSARCNMCLVFPNYINGHFSKNNSVHTYIKADDVWSMIPLKLYSKSINYTMNAINFGTLAIISMILPFGYIFALTSFKITISFSGENRITASITKVDIWGHDYYVIYLISKFNIVFKTSHAIRTH